MLGFTFPKLVRCVADHFPGVITDDALATFFQKHFSQPLLQMEEDIEDDQVLQIQNLTLEAARANGFEINIATPAAAAHTEPSGTDSDTDSEDLAC